MRKCLLFTLLLLIAAAGVLWSAFGLLDREKEAVSVAETVLSGDRAAAAGISVTNRTVCGGHLYWDTVYTVGEGLDTATSFTFAQTERGWSRESESRLDIYCPLNFGIGGNAIDLEEQSSYSGVPIAPVLDVAGRTPAGETREETLRLRDYYEYYPLTVEFSPYLYGGPDRDAELAQAFVDYLKVPVPATHRIQVSVAKDSGGSIVNVDCQSVSGEVSFRSLSVMTDGGCYFILFASDGDTGLPVQLPEGLSGIHFIPIEQGGEQRAPVAAGLRLLYPLDEKAVRPLDLLEDARNRLLLFTGENGAVYLSVLDEKTMLPLQKVELTVPGSGAELGTVRQEDGFLLATCSDGGFSLLAEQTGGYELQMTGNLYACEEIGQDVPTWNMALDYDGARLAAAFYPQSRNTTICSTYLMVFGEYGLVYAGRYDHGADRRPERSGMNFDDLVRPLDADALSVVCG
jgi:hypothetical protein